MYLDDGYGSVAIGEHLFVGGHSDHGRSPLQLLRCLHFELFFTAGHERNRYEWMRIGVVINGEVDASM